MILRNSFFLLLASLLVSIPAFAKKPLDIDNLNHETQQELLKRFPGVSKEKSSLEQVDDVIRFLQAKPEYGQVQVVDDGGTAYKIQFTKNKRVHNVKFSGLSAISESEARNYFTVKTGDAYDQEVIIENGESLRQAYRNLGFQNAVIDIELPPDEKNADQIVVEVKVNENKQTEINSVSFSSPSDKLNRLLTDALHSKKGDALTDVTLSEVQKKIRETLTKNHYIRADVQGPEIKYNSDESRADLIFKLDRVNAYVVELSGYKQESSSSIEDFLNLDEFYSSNPNIGQELANKVRSLYLSRGYARVEVNSKETDSREAFEKKILLTIEEGPQIKIQKIVVNGKISDRESFYEKFLRKHSSALIERGYYNKEDLDLGISNLKLELQNQGHLLCKVLSSRTQYTREKNQVTVIINIDEGPITAIQDIEFEGNTSFTKEKLLAISKMSSSGPLRLSEIDTAIANIKNFYHDSGYIEMMLLNEKEDLVTYDDTNTRASLNFKIFEGPQVKVATIVLEGNNFTKDYVVLKELEFGRGDILTPYKLDESVARLQRTGFFSTVEIKTLEEKTNVANRTVIVRISERDPGVLTLGAGATSERIFTLRGYTGIAYRNLRGTGRGISLRLEGNYNIAQVKYLESKVLLGYLEPYLFDTRVRGRINLSRTKTVTDYDLRQITEINQISYSVEKDFTSHILGVYEVYGLATIKQTGIDDAYSLPSTNLDIATTGPSVDIDFRDNPFNPTRGTFTRISAEYSSPYFPADGLGSTQTVNYVRATASFTHYLKLSDGPVVFANNIQGGYLENLSTEPNGGVPYDIKGFILGGRSTVRGFEAGTSDVFPNKTDLGSDQYNLTTSAEMFLIKSELRFPIYGNFAGATFYDGGYVGIRNLELSDRYRDSVGVGLRYNTPVGPLNLEWAWKLDRKDGEAGNRFHLSIGTF